jgi:hypothetical protein
LSPQAPPLSDNCHGSPAQPRSQTHRPGRSGIAHPAVKGTNNRRPSPGKPATGSPRQAMQRFPVSLLSGILPRDGTPLGRTLAFLPARWPSAYVPSPPKWLAPTALPARTGRGAVSHATVPGSCRACSPRTVPATAVPSPSSAWATILTAAPCPSMTGRCGPRWSLGHAERDRQAGRERSRIGADATSVGRPRDLSHVPALRPSRLATSRPP